MENSTILRYEQDFAYDESEMIDRMKAISKQEEETKQKLEREAQTAYDNALKAEKADIQAVRAKRLLALKP
jgi:Spy/CpxP family protein refolding chaperone